MKRREFVAGLGSAAAWPMMARAQGASLPVVGYLDQYAPEPTGAYLQAFRKGLADLGFVEGRNIAIEFRYANNDNNRLAETAAELIHRHVAIIVTPFGSAAARTAKGLTTTIPIMFMTSADPVQEHLVASFNRPGANVTGLSTMNVELGAKRLGIFHELVPGAARISALVNPNNTIADALTDEIRTSASLVGWQVEIVHPSTSSEIDTAFADFEKQRVDAAVVSPDVFYTSRRVQFAILASRYRIPVMYGYRGFAEAGGLISYGPNLPDLYRQLGAYTGRVLKGEPPASLPVVQPTRFELVINRHSANTLNLTVPSTLLAIADEVIE